MKLILENGKEFLGNSIGSNKSTSGEIVFNTAITGYPETLTDPSYKGQIIVLTFPIIGNYGIPHLIKENNLLKYFESDKIHIVGLIVNNYSKHYSHWNAYQNLQNWLENNQIPAISNIDTRLLTKIIREKGSILGKIIYKNDINFTNPNIRNLVDEVSCKNIIHYGKSNIKVILIDCGVKYSIIRCLLKRGIEVIRIPWNYNYSEIEHDGILISNGPGNPELCDITIKHLKKSIEESHKPIFGICLGHQLLGLASGAKTFKLKYGHRSQNQPIINIRTNQCYITSQNHGYAIDNTTLAQNWNTYFINLNDKTCEGIYHKKKPFSSVQFHPEGAPGPLDTEYLFDKFLEDIKIFKKL